MADAIMTTAELAGLAQEVRDALDLAVAEGGPVAIVEKLALAAGLLAALVEVPTHTLVPLALQRRRAALEAWEKHAPKRAAA